MSTIIGGKSRHAKEISELLFRIRSPGQPYYEPFVGGANIVSRMGGERHANDSNPYLVAYYKAMQTDWEPPVFVTRPDYYYLKNNQPWAEPALIGYIGHGYAFAGKWFGPYAHERFEKARLAKNRYNKLKPLMQGVHLTSGSYDQMIIPDGSLVYCDPPYADVTCAYYSKDFDSEDFWTWAKDLSQRCTVLVSEYQAPDGWDCVWEKGVRCTLSENSDSLARVERVFRLQK